MKTPLKAYAIVDYDGHLACWSHYVPIFWFRRAALSECKAECFADSKVIAVLVTPLPPVRVRKTVKQC